MQPNEKANWWEIKRQTSGALAKVVAAIQPRRAAHEAQAASAQPELDNHVFKDSDGRACSSPDGADKQPAQAQDHCVFAALHGRSDLHVAARVLQLHPPRPESHPPCKL